MAGLELVPFGEAEADYAITYRKQARKIKFADAAILTTAGADLLTRNTDDFAGRAPLVRLLTIQELSGG